MTRHAFVGEARRWVGTPYRHASAVKGVGCDCLGLVTGVARAVFGPDALPPPPDYAPDWAEATGRELLLDALTAHLVEVRRDVRPPAFRPAEILLFRWRDGRPASHLAIATGEGTLVHAHVRAVVAEVALTPGWRRRLAGIFILPEIR
jgi:NlpC/P60 family putative phage cell wall peptidase